MRFPSFSVSLCLAAVAAMTAATAAHAAPVTINFESQAAGAPSSFNGTVQTITIGNATFTGGQLLNNESNGVDQSGVYATASFFPANSQINITFASAVSDFSLLLTNNIADGFTVSDNLGASVSANLAQNSMRTFSLTGGGITRVSITAAQSSGAFDYAIDNVMFNTAATTAATPEPSSLWLLGTGVVGAAGAFRRRLIGA